MPIRCMQGVVATSLLAMSLSATAATVQVEAFLLSGNGSSADNVLNPPGCTPGSTTLTECVSITRSVGLGSPIPDTGTITYLRSVFQAGNVSPVPNFVLNGNARAFASFGELHASNFVQIQGAGGNSVSIGGRSFAQLSDRVTIHSSVLPSGSTVTIRVLMDVTGTGGGQLFFGANQVQTVGQADDFPPGSDALKDYETTFTAKVGDQLNLTYGLLAYSRIFSAGWTANNVLNGRNNSSDYGNSVYLYLGGQDPSQGITLQSNSGYIYATSPVPEPASAWLLLIGLPLLARRARKPSYGAGG